MKYSKLAIIATIFAFVVSNSFTYADSGFDIKEPDEVSVSEGAQNKTGTSTTATKAGESIYYRIKVTCKIGPLPELGGNLTTKYYYCKSSVKLTKKNTNSVDVVQSLQWEF